MQKACSLGLGNSNWLLKGTHFIRIPDSSASCLFGFSTNEHLRHIVDRDARNSSESMVIVLAPWEKLWNCADDFSKIGFIRTYSLTALVQSCTLFISKSRACHWNSWVKIWQAQRAADKHGKSNATRVAGKAFGQIRSWKAGPNMFKTFCWRDVGGWKVYSTCVLQAKVRKRVQEGKLQGGFRQVQNQGKCLGCASRIK